MEGNAINYNMKLFSAIAIIAVCVGHIQESGLNGPFEMIRPYSYQVAAFVFVSGYFFSTGKIETSPSKYVAHKFKRLIVPLILINAVYGLVILALHGLGFTFGENPSFKTLLIDPFTTGHQFLINMPMWFLAPLFFAEIFNVAVSLMLGRWIGAVKELVVFIAYLSVGAIAIVMGGVEGLRPGIGLLAARTAFFISCFGMGRFYRQVLERHDNLRSVWYFLIVLTAQLIVIWICDGDYVYGPSWCKFPNGIFLTYATTILSIAFVLRICKILGPIIGRSRTVLAIADNTFSIMCHHIFGFFLVTSFFALIAYTTPLLQNFDFSTYHDLYRYYFFPRDVQAFAFVYVVFGIAFSICVHWAWSKLCSHMRGVLANQGLPAIFVPVSRGTE